MQHIEQKLNDTNTAFSNALDALARARQDYETGAGRTLAETMRNSETLHELIAAQTQASQAAKDALKVALRLSNAATTSETKAALTARRNADDLIEEYSELLTEADFRLVEVVVAASGAADSLESAYSNARAAQVEQTAYAALAQGGKAIAQAMAMGGGEIIWTELERLAKELEFEARQSQIDQLGNLDLGALTRSDRMNPVEVTQTRRVVKGEVPGHALDSVIRKSGRSSGLVRALGTIRDRMSKALNT